LLPLRIWRRVGPSSKAIWRSTPPYRGHPGVVCQTGTGRKDRLPHVTAFEHNCHHGRETGDIALNRRK
jgi:hypothetical protein